MSRYARNIGAITSEEQQILNSKKVLVVGLGGLGGYVCEFLARVGVGAISICDFDVFDESNLNRQINANEKTLSKSKVEVCKERLTSVNSSIHIIGYDMKFDENTAKDMLIGVDLVIDALDNIPSRFVLEDECAKARIPLVFGALSLWEGQVTTIYPDKKRLSEIYPDLSDIVDKSKYEKVPVMAFTPAIISGYQVAEAVKIFLGKGELKDKLLLVDIESNTTKLIDI